MLISLGQFHPHPGLVHEPFANVRILFRDDSTHLADQPEIVFGLAEPVLTCISVGEGIRVLAIC